MKLALASVAAMLLFSFQPASTAAEELKRTAAAIESTQSAAESGNWVEVSDDGGKTYQRIAVPRTVRYAPTVPSSPTAGTRPQSNAVVIESWKEWENQQAQIDEEHRPYELKGDRLGMTLQMFKAKYYREMGQGENPAPFCSDRTPHIDICTLLYKAEYAKAGIVHASTTFPYEASGLRPNKPTIAGVPAELFVYQFVDGKLYEITIFFDQADFDQVMEALKAKYGEPTRKNRQTYENAFGAKFDGDVVVWANAVSEIMIYERAGRTDQSLLIFTHKKLSETAADHMKTAIKPRADDL